MDEKLLAAGRKYAQAHDTTFNALVRDLVRRTVKPDSADRVKKMIQKMRRAEGRSNGKKWTREDAYDV